MPAPLRATFDPATDAVYIYLTAIRPGEAIKQHVCDEPDAKGDVILDFDAEGRLLGIEVLHASKALPAELLERAERLWGGAVDMPAAGAKGLTSVTARAPVRGADRRLIGRGAAQPA